MGATFGELLADHEATRARYLARLNGPRFQLLEDRWASSDPFQADNRLDAGLGNAQNDLLFHGALHAHSARPGSRRHGDFPPFYRTEMEHWMIVDAARVLEAVCPTATNILDVLSQFAIFTGFEYTIVERKQPGTEVEVQEEFDEDGETEPEKPKSNPLVEKVQAALDKWIKEVRWYQWEVELFRRSRRDGEAFLVLEEDELTDVGYHFRTVEPEQVKEPLHITSVNSRAGIDGRAKSWKYGILTDKDDTAVPLSYWVVSQYAGDKALGTMYEAEEVFHLKTEWVDRMAKRGVSDFFCVANDLPRVKKMLRNLLEGGTVQAAIAWIRENPPGMGAPAPLGAPTTTRTGQTTNAVTYDGATMLDVPNGLTYTAGPMGAGDKAAALVEILQAGLRNIGSRWQMPEGMVSGDASNANLASALVAEGPFVRALEMRQWHYRNAYCRLLERVLDQAAIQGRLGPARENLFDEIELSVEAKPVVARKMSEETDRNRILSAAGLLSDQSWAAREDLDFEDEQANMEEHPTQAQRFEKEGMEDDEESSSETPVHKEPEGERIT